MGSIYENVCFWLLSVTREKLIRIGKAQKTNSKKLAVFEGKLDQPATDDDWKVDEWREEWSKNEKSVFLKSLQLENKAIKKI